MIRCMKNKKLYKIKTQKYRKALVATKLFHIVLWFKSELQYSQYDQREEMNNCVKCINCKMHLPFFKFVSWFNGGLQKVLKSAAFL